VKLPENPEDSVAIGTGMLFDYLPMLGDGFMDVKVFG